MAYLIYCILTLTAIIIIIAASICLLFNLFTKQKSRKSILLWIFIGFLLLYLIFFAGEYNKWNLNKSTQERLLSLSINNYEQNQFIIKIKDMDVDIEIINDSIDDYGNMIYYDFYAKIFERQLKDLDSFVLIMPRTSDRTLDKFPPISTYENTLIIVNESTALKISFLEKENSSKTLNTILDKLEEMKVIDSK